MHDAGWCDPPAPDGPLTPASGGVRLARRVNSSAHGERLVDHAKQHLATIPVGEIGECIRHGGITVNGAVVSIAHRVATDDVLRLTTDAWSGFVDAGRVTPVSDRSLVVHHEDDDLIIVDKPGGIHVHPMGQHRDDTLLGALLRLAGASDTSPWADWRPYPVHRLDRPVSGLIAHAKHRAARDVLQRHLEARRIERTYRALVRGVLDDDAGTIDIPLGVDPAGHGRRTRIDMLDGGQEAVTHFAVVTRRSDDTTEVTLRLETGRTHQLRAHLALLGHPILGDRRYEDLDGPPLPRGPIGGMPTISLHATRLVLPHPVTGDPVTASSTPPWATD